MEITQEPKNAESKRNFEPLNEDSDAFGTITDIPRAESTAASKKRNLIEKIRQNEQKYFGQANHSQT